MEDVEPSASSSNAPPVSDPSIVVPRQESPSLSHLLSTLEFSEQTNSDVLLAVAMLVRFVWVLGTELATTLLANKAQLLSMVKRLREEDMETTGVDKELLELIKSDLADDEAMLNQGHLSPDFLKFIERLPVDVVKEADAKVQEETTLLNKSKLESPLKSFLWGTGSLFAIWQTFNARKSKTGKCWHERSFRDCGKLTLTGDVLFVVSSPGSHQRARHDHPSDLHQYWWCRRFCGYERRVCALHGYR